MLLANYYETYKDEIELIRAQNRVECDMYSIIAYIIRTGNQGKNISLRDVSVRRETDFSRRFRGNSGFSDFVIFERKKDEDAKILGAIEAKYVDENLDLEKHLEQLKDHRDCYKQVIYTNGLEWRFYNQDGSEMKWNVILGKVLLGEDSKTKIAWNDDSKWKCLLEKLDRINWIQ